MLSSPDAAHAVGINIALFSYSYPSGDVEFDPSVPIESVKAKSCRLNIS
jgi:hypothetical protein